MLLAHPWLKPLGRPETIAEDIEAEDAAAEDELVDATGSLSIDSPTGAFAGDHEIAEWVSGVLERKRKGLLKDSADKPALHAAPLDSVSPVTSPMIPV